MDLGLRGKRALVGGATSGLGRAVAEALAAEGCRLVLWARDEGRLVSAADALRKRFDAEVAVVAADATRPATANEVAEAAQASFNGIDIVVLNAGGPPTVDPLATTAEGWREALQLLVITPVAVATGVLPGMRERGFGRIVAILSSGIREPIPNLVYSNAGRAALVTWLKTASRPLADDGVTANGVVPGRISTPRTRSLDEMRAERERRPVDEIRRESEAQIPAGRYGEPGELAAAVAFLCSERAGYIAGSLVTVDGGMLRSL